MDKINKSNIKDYIINRLEHFEDIALTNSYYNQEIYREDRKKLINELEKEFDCEIDILNYNIKFKNI